MSEDGAVTSFTCSLSSHIVLKQRLVLFYQILMGKMQSSIRQKSIKVTDFRVQKMNELLTYVKLIKMYAWEVPFSKDIAGRRQ